jgi:fumarylacetoacetate (FAA) hydrolase
MKLASLRDVGPDGALLVVSRDLCRARLVADIVPTMQQALESWEQVEPQLQHVYAALNADPATGFALDQQRLAAVLPRCYQWLDGSAYLPHVRRVRQARGAELPEQLLTDPLMYQGCGDQMLGPRESIPLVDESWGLDFESEVGVITDLVPMGVVPEQAAGHIRLLLLINDISLRNLIPPELAKGFGFLQGKPASALSPVAVTPDELGGAWDGGRLHLPLRTWLNGEWFGEPDAGVDMQFDFPTLISHAARSRILSAGTLVGSGTVSNADSGRGSSCLVERRVLEIIEGGEAMTPYLKAGDRVRISMQDAAGCSIFGDIEQQVVPWKD